MPHFLISGIPEQVAEVATVLREHGATSVGVDDIHAVAAACAEADRSFDGYVQLAASFQVAGESAVARIHHFFSEGVLARFPAVTAALPHLEPNARLTFVLGVLPPEVSTDDDRAARSALVRVLAHAACADGPPGLRATVLDSGSSAEEIALTALGSSPRPAEHSDGFGSRSYADWRVELLGMMSAYS